MRGFLLLVFVGWAAAQNSGDLRLVRNGITNSSYTSGQLEVYYSGEWGTVCDNNWDSVDTGVACRQLGFPSFNLVAYTTSSVGGFGSAPAGQRIWLSNVNCFGSETMLTRCQSNRPFGFNNCLHFDDVAIYCTTDDVPQSIRIVGIAVGVSVAALTLFVIIPVIVVGVICFCKS